MQVIAPAVVVMLCTCNAYMTPKDLHGMLEVCLNCTGVLEGQQSENVERGDTVPMLKCGVGDRTNEYTRNLFTSNPSAKGARCTILGGPGPQRP